MSIKVILADDHAMFRHGLSKSFQNEKDMEIIAQAKDGRTTVELAKELSPNIIIMDIGMPDLNGIEATRQIIKECPKVKIIALSMHSSKNFIIEMFKAGASGYLLKDCEFDELVNAIRLVVNGKKYISPAISDVVVDNYMQQPDNVKDSAFSILSQREREVLQLLTEGKATKQIGKRLHISAKTVEVHRLNLMNKLKIDNIAQLTKYAVQEGLTRPEP
ncbi:MAG: response regulator transcription factor [Sedimentisphaerales bacterium]|jgi:DNA-binding NarL/FixJ family response regulator